MDVEMKGALHDIEDSLWEITRDYTYEQVKHDLEGLKKAREDTDDLPTQFFLTFEIMNLERILESKEAHNVSSE